MSTKTFLAALMLVAIVAAGLLASGVVSQAPKTARIPDPTGQLAAGAATSSPDASSPDASIPPFTITCDLRHTGCTYSDGTKVSNADYVKNCTSTGHNADDTTETWTCITPAAAAAQRADQQAAAQAQMIEVDCTASGCTFASTGNAAPSPIGSGCTNTGSNGTANVYSCPGDYTTR